MPAIVQNLTNSSICVRGSYNVTTNLNVHVSNAVSTRSGPLSPFRSGRSSHLDAESLSDLLVQAECLQRSAQALSNKLKITLQSPIQYQKLITTLDELSNETILDIFRFSPLGHRLDRQREQRVLQEIAWMQAIIDKFIKRVPTNSGSGCGPAGVLTAKETFFYVLWCCFWWLVYARYWSTSLRKALEASRERISLTLFEHMRNSLGARVYCHQIEIVDFFGAEWSLPRDLCLHREAFFQILDLKYQDGPAEHFITSLQVAVVCQDGRRVTPAQSWEEAIKAQDSIQLSVMIDRYFIDARKETPARCPQCCKTNKTIADRSGDGWMECLRCSKYFTTRRGNTIGCTFVNGDQKPTTKTFYLKPKFLQTSLEGSKSLNDDLLVDIGAFRYVTITVIEIEAILTRSSFLTSSSLDCSCGYVIRREIHDSENSWNAKLLTHLDMHLCNDRGKNDDILPFQRQRDGFTRGQGQASSCVLLLLDVS